MTPDHPATLRSDVHLAPMDAGYGPAVLDIYAAGIATGLATFSHEAPTWAEFTTSHLDDHRYVALDDDGTVLGWVALSPVSGRCVYAGVVELSVYVAPFAQGRGVGTALHSAAGFRVVGTRERLGLMTHGPLAGTWLDVVLLERRL